MTIENPAAIFNPSYREKAMDALLKRSLLVLAAACLILAASAGWVMAQNFTAGSFNFEPRFSAYGTSNPRVNSIMTYGGAFNFYVLDNFAVEAEGMGVYIDQTKRFETDLGVGTKSDPTNGIGGNINLRWHFVATGQATMFAGAGVGGLWADAKTPYNGFENNLTENGEIGATYSLTQQLSLKGSVKYLHIGQFNNQGINAFGGTVGLNVSF
jgi:outer membrane protein W